MCITLNCKRILTGLTSAFESITEFSFKFFDYTVERVIIILNKFYKSEKAQVCRFNKQNDG